MTENFKYKENIVNCVQMELFQESYITKENEKAECIETNNQGIEDSLSASSSKVDFYNEDTDVEEAILVNDINGLTYVRNFISESEQNSLLKKIDSELWLTELKRRVQHYGYKYDYAKHQINNAMYIAPLPDWSLAVAKRLQQSYSPTLPDQVIVNEYEPGQGIANHIDCKTCFKDTIISLSLGSPCVMEFINPKKDLKKSLLLEPRSLIILKGEARYEWAHGIAKRKSDNFQGQIFKRTRRVSLTFRTVFLQN